ncbi:MULTISPECIES: SRPBCC family protein [Sphingomonas]|uniref:SRPBCC domain-containing protein n=1 Tax=Sphingomonas lycopersici TaxID=2951807 RepID=A0AA41ZBN6_9SPHN|nr:MULTISPECIES: SRPBCC domain-containing protein [Sphingomonas]MCW6530848.1 SRPBCC domain-containing protein [Sphingomonas lycopersici]MCW6536663.1 SRPBCC domain-containing protein [Sphingomonas lycopersici]OJU20417.1 MAG: activator of Hsp90 ATPase 1 family protein [Sphingomonas sp. 66-10]
MTDQIQSSIVIERSYAADREALWALWTTKDGFESWWGPEGFRADVREIEAQPDGALHYAMVADAPDMVAAMKQMGQPTSTECKGRFSEFRPYDRLVLTQIIDFLPGVQPYDSTIEVDFIPAAEGKVRMIVTLHQMHDAKMTQMQRMGFTSQLTKLDKRFGWTG